MRCVMKRPVVSSILVAVVLLALAVTAEAQQPARLPRVGVLLLNPLSSRPQQLEAFRQGLRAHGYVEGQNIVIELRSAEGKSERLAELAAELVQAHADVLVAAGTEPIQAAQKATRSIPIVMMSVGDPVGAGIVASLARPGKCHGREQSRRGTQRKTARTP